MAVSRRRRSTAPILRAGRLPVIIPGCDTPVPLRDDARDGTREYRPRMPELQPADLDAPISVLIADDQVLVRAGLRAVLAGQPGITVCGEAADGREAIDLVRAHRPDVVLMDIQMPGIDGLQATRRVLEDADPEHPVAILILTTFDLDAYVYDALRAGASGFLLKDTLPEDLVAAIRIVARGDALIAPGITKRLIEQFARSAPAGTPPGALDELTPRETEVLVL